MYMWKSYLYKTTPMDKQNIITDSYNNKWFSLQLVKWQLGFWLEFPNFSICLLFLVSAY